MVIDRAKHVENGEREMERSAATGTLFDRAGRLLDHLLVDRRGYENWTGMSGWEESASAKTRSPPKLFISHSASLPPFHSIFSFPSSSHPRASSLACSAIDAGGRAPSHCTSSFPLLGATLSSPSLPSPSSLNNSVSLGSSVLVPSFLSDLRPSTGNETSPSRSHPGFPPTLKSIRSCGSYPASCLRNFRPPWRVLRNVNSSFSFS